MDTLVVGLALWISGAGVPPTPGPSSAPTVLTATRVTLREAVARATLRDSAPREFQLRQPARVSRFSKTDRIIAVVAGVCGGWMAGGAIGCKAASRREYDDGASCLRGVMIGAPIGAVVGAVVAYRFTK